MAIHWDDVKANIKEFLVELRGQKIGILGFSMIFIMLVIGLLAPVIAPDAHTEWGPGNERWSNNPRAAPPAWIDYVTAKSYAHQKTLNTVSTRDSRQIGDNTIYIRSWNFKMDSDVPPKDIIAEIRGTADSVTSANIIIERPDDRSITLMSLSGSDVFHNGTVSKGMTTARSQAIRDTLYTHVSDYLREEEGMTSEEMISKVNMNPTKTIFGKANEDWLDSPDTLKGEYKLKLVVTGNNLKLNEDSKVILAGAVFGVMGTDYMRQDIWQGWVWGARYGLIAGGIVAVITIILGTFYGMTSAYYGGWVDELMQRGNEIAMGIPTLPILIMVLKFWRTSIWVFVLIYSLLMWRGIAKIIRSRGLQVRQDTYVEAAESLGSSSGRVIRSHMIPQILPYAVAEAALMVPMIIIAEAGLHMLGLGDPDIVTWGTQLTEANQSGATLNFTASWHWVLFPGLGMIFLGFGFIATGMAVEKIVNPKMQQR